MTYAEVFEKFEFKDPGSGDMTSKKIPEITIVMTTPEVGLMIINGTDGTFMRFGSPDYLNHMISSIEVSRMVLS